MARGGVITLLLVQTSFISHMMTAAKYQSLPPNIWISISSSENKIRQSVTRA